MKKTIALFMMNLTFFSYSEEIKPEIPITTETAIEIKKPEITIKELLDKKQYLNEFMNEEYKPKVFYNSEGKIEKLEFSKKDYIISYIFYSFEEDRIFQIIEKKGSEETFKEFYFDKTMKKSEKTAKNIKTIEEFDESGFLKRNEKIIKNKKTYEEYFKIGSIKEKGQYDLLNNQWEKTGNWEEYYENGKIKNSYLFNGSEYYEISYLNDEKNNKTYEGKNVFIDGKWYKDELWTFYENGKLSYRAEFFKEKGKFYNYYDESSNIISIETSVVFVNNNWVWQGQKIFYSNNGQTLEKQFKENSILSITGYYENKKNTIRYKGERDLNKNSFDKIGTWIYFDENEKIVEVIEYKDKEAKIKEYFDFENNKIKFSGNIIKKGEYYSWVGNQVYYDNNSNKEVEIQFLDDGNGKITHFYEDGKIFKEGDVWSDYIQNPTFYIGQLKEYGNDGKLKVIYNYEKGLLEGETLYYDNNENLTVKKIYKNGELLKIENIK